MGYIFNSIIQPLSLTPFVRDGKCYKRTIVSIYDFEIDQGVDRQMRGLLLMTNALDARSGE